MNAAADESARAARRLPLSRSRTLVGLDYVVFERRRSTQLGDVARVRAHFVKRAFGGWDLERVGPEHLSVTLDGGVDARGVQVTRVGKLGRDTLGVDLLFDPRDRVPGGGDDQPTFTLSLTGLDDVTDPFFRDAPFRVDPPSEVRALPKQEPAPTDDSPAIDYLAKDYSTLLTLIDNRMREVAPSWTETSPADAGVMIEELLAYVGDALSYNQDAIGTEAYLSHARLRVSVQRHTALLGYDLGQGLNSLVWVRFEAYARCVLPARTTVLSRVPGQPVCLEPWQAAALATAVPFETVQSIDIEPNQNSIDLYDFGARTLVLPVGATSACLAGHHDLPAGTVLSFEQDSSRLAADPALAAPDRSWVVRLSTDAELCDDRLLGKPYTRIRWFDDDALPQTLVASAIVDGAYVSGATTVHGNLVLADLGGTRGPESLGSQPTDGERWLPKLKWAQLVFARPLDLQALQTRPATAVTTPDDVGRPQISVTSTTPLAPERRWQWKPTADLTTATPFERRFAVEVDDRQGTQLRFGDDTFGRAPTQDERFEATYRTASWRTGELGPNTLAHVVTDASSITRVVNPAATFGAVAPESVDEARTLAPAQLHQPLRCVTAEDYRDAALQVPDVARAHAAVRWDGDEAVMTVFVERTDARPADGPFCATVRDYLVPRSLAGVPVAVLPPDFVPILVRVSVATSTLSHQVATTRALEALAPLFERTNPDALSFGDGLRGTEVIRRLAGVHDLSSIKVLQLHKLDEHLGDPLSPDDEAKHLSAGPGQILAAVNDPRAPMRGLVTVEVMS